MYTNLLILIGERDWEKAIYKRAMIVKKEKWVLRITGNMIVCLGLV